MKSIRSMRTFGCQIICIFIILLISNSLHGYPTEPSTNGVTFKAETITVIVGESTIVKTPWPTMRVAITDPKIADVKVLTPYQVLLQGTKVGSTDLIVWSEDGMEVWQWKVLVGLDLAGYKGKLDELFPHCLLEVSQFGETLIVKGLLRSAEETVQLDDFLTKAGVKYVDMTSVAGVQQVQLQVRVAEVSRTAIRALGINAFYTDPDFFVASRAGSETGGALVPSISIGPAAGTGLGSTSFVFQSAAVPSTPITIFAGIPSIDFEVFLKALAENRYLRILANPTLVALSGETASFLAGGEFPIPIPQSGAGTGGQPTITIRYKEYGVRLLFRPIVLGDGTIRLTVSPEVSELTTINAIEIGGVSVPSLLTRKMETTLELKSGQTFAMAGLIQNKVEAINSRIPGFGDLPVLGPLFRSVSYAEDETELVVLVTASLVEPMSLAAMPPLPGFLHVEPNDWELYLEGRIEGKAPVKINPTDATWLKQIGLDRLVGPGAWESYGQAIPSSQAETDPDTQDIDTQSLQIDESIIESSSTNSTGSAYPVEEELTEE